MEYSICPKRKQRHFEDSFRILESARTRIPAFSRHFTFCEGHHEHNLKSESGWGDKHRNQIKSVMLTKLPEITQLASSCEYSYHAQLATQVCINKLRGLTYLTFYWRSKFKWWRLIFATSGRIDRAFCKITLCNRMLRKWNCLTELSTRTCPNGHLWI